VSKLDDIKEDLESGGYQDVNKWKMHCTFLIKELENASKREKIMRDALIGYSLMSFYEGQSYPVDEARLALKRIEEI